MNTPFIPSQYQVVAINVYLRKRYPSTYRHLLRRTNTPAELMLAFPADKFCHAVRYILGPDVGK